MTSASEMLGVAGHAGSQVTPTGWRDRATDAPARGADPAGTRVLVVQRLLALNAVIWFNWQIGAPVKRSLIAYDH